MKTPDNHNVSSNIVIFPWWEQHSTKSQIAEEISRIMDLLSPEVDDFIDRLVQKHQHEQTQVSWALRQIANTILWVFDQLKEYDDEVMISTISIILTKYYAYLDVHQDDVSKNIDDAIPEDQHSISSKANTYIHQKISAIWWSHSEQELEKMYTDMYQDAVIIADVFLTLQSEVGVWYDNDTIFSLICVKLDEYHDDSDTQIDTTIVNDNIISLWQTSWSLDLLVHDLLTQMAEDRSREKWWTEKEHYDDMKPNANFITQVLSYIEYFWESDDTFTNECIIATIADVMPCEYISWDASDIWVQEPDQELSYIRDKVHSSDLKGIMDDIDASARKIFLRDHPGCDIDHEYRNDTKHSMHYATNLILDIFENISQNNGIVYKADLILSVLRSWLEWYEKHLYKAIDDSPLETDI